jgi:hypothetical protein
MLSLPNKLTLRRYFVRYKVTQFIGLGKEHR